MPRRNRTFTETDVMRFILTNLTDIERDTVICTVVGLTGARLRGSVSTGDIIDFLNAFKAASLVGKLLLVKDLRDGVRTLPKYDRDY